MKHNSLFKIYLWVFLGLFIGALSIVAATNFMIDPYNQFGRNTIGLYFSSERQTKSNISKVPHDAIIMGSSRVAHIDPKELCSYDFYNASFASALPEEMFVFLKQYAIEEKIVMIGLDFYMFNESAFPYQAVKSFNENQYSSLEYLLSSQVFGDSLKALKFQAQKKQTRIANNGQIVMTEFEVGEFEPKEFFKWVNLYRERNYLDYRLSEKRIKNIRDTYELLESRGIKPVFFINPEHPQIHQLVLDPSLDSIYRRWKIRLKEEIPDLIDLTDPRYHCSEHKLFYPNDPAHYLPKTGSGFINHILGCGSGSKESCGYRNHQ